MFQKPDQQNTSTDRERNPSRASGLSDESVEFVLIPPPAQGIPSDNNYENFQPTRTPTPPMQAPAPPKVSRNYSRTKPVQKRKDPARMVLPAPAPLSPVEYEVEKIVDSRRYRGVRQYRVKWKGFNEENNTWEPETNLADCKELLQAFKRAQQNTNGRPRRSRITQPQHAMKTLNDYQKSQKSIPSLAPTAANNSVTSIAETIAKLTKSNTNQTEPPTDPRIKTPETPPAPKSPQIELENETEEEIHKPRTPEMEDIQPISPKKPSVPSWAVYKPTIIPDNLKPELLKNEISMKLLVISGELINCLLGENKRGDDIQEHTKVRLFLEPPPPKITKNDLAEKSNQDQTNPYNQSILSSNSSFEISEQILRVTGHHEHIGQAVYMFAKKVMSSELFLKQLETQPPHIPRNRITLQIILPDVICTAIFGPRGEKIHELEAESNVKLSNSKEWVENEVNYVFKISYARKN